MTGRWKVVCWIVSICCGACCAQAADGDQLDLPVACLIAGAVNDKAELSRARERLDAVCQSIATPSLAELPAQDRASVLLRRMHARMLTGRYDRGASDWRIALDRGDYNCLSAVVIFHELCRQADVPLTLWAEPGHVHCRLGNTRIEPTVRKWPGSSDSASAVARQLTAQQLVGRFYYNRGIELLESRDFAGGVAALQMACQLDPLDADARANLLAGLNNWAIALTELEQHAAARSLIARGLAIDPAFAPLVTNERYLHRRAITSP
jgi:tetratricopeptide (TPR) repeat protein